MNKTKEEEKKFIYVHKIHTAPIHSCFWVFIVKKGTNAFDEKNKKTKKYAAFSQKYYACGPEFSTIKTLTYCEPIVLLSP